MIFTRIYRSFILLCGCLTPAVLAPAPQTEQPTLRTVTESIHCAASSDVAAYHLRNLQLISLLPPGVPDESINSAHPELRAATLDRVLTVLYQSAKKYPSNKNLVEQTVIQWNFCSVIDNGKFFDHYELNGRAIRAPSKFHKDYHWDGFRAFGLLPATARTGVFDFTTPYTNSTIRPLADRRQQQTYINHCLPHPNDEHLYRDFGRNFISRVSPPTPTRSPLPEKEWNLECKTEVPALTQAADLTKPQEQNSTVQNAPLENAKLPLAIDDAAIASSLPTTKINDVITSDPVPELAASIEMPAEAQDAAIASTLPTTKVNDVITSDPVPELAAAIELPAEAQVVVQPEPETPVPESVVVAIPADLIEPLFAAAIEGAEGATPIVVTGPRNGNDIVIPASSTSKGFSGSISLNNSAFNANKTSLNFAISYKPIRDSYWFIRSGFELSPFIDNDRLTYSWGFGYDDWHPGTWAIQLNHWGPLKPGDGLDVENAVAELSYKIKNSWLAEHNLSSSLALAKPLSSDPSLKWGWSWNPYSHWFVRSTLSRPIGKSGLNWSYGFGYTRYDANSLSLEYNNWGLNEFPDLNFNKNALTSLIYRWAF